MNNKKISILVFVLFFLFMVYCTFTDVNAADCKCNPGDILISKKDGVCTCESADVSACKYLMEDGVISLAAVAEKYDAEIAMAGNNQVKITINPVDKNDSSVIEKLQDVRFKVISINGVEDKRNLSVGYDCTCCRYTIPRTV